MRPDNRNDHENKSEHNACCVHLFVLTLILGLLGAVISYFVFAIISLVENYNISKDCKGSNLWEYVLATIILNSNVFSIQFTSDKNIDLSVCVLGFIAITELGLAIWGGNEIFKYSCNNLNNTLLWKIALASFIKQIFFAFILVVVAPVCLIAYSCNDCFKNSNSLSEREYESFTGSENNTENNTENNKENNTENNKENNTDLTTIIIDT